MTSFSIHWLPPVILKKNLNLITVMVYLIYNFTFSEAYMEMFDFCDD